MMRQTARMRMGFGAVLLVALTLLVAPTARAAEVEFVDPEGRFSIIVPENTEQLSPDQVRDLARAGGAASAASNIVVMFRDPVTMSNVSVGAASFGSTNTSAEEGAQQLTRFLGSTDGITLDPEGIRQETIGGEDARWYGYTLTGEGAELRGQQYLIFRDGIGYFITFTAPRDDFDRFFDETRIILDAWNFR